MERYFFHLHDGKSLTDEEGTELESLDAAKKAAIQLIAQTLRDDVDTFWQDQTYGVTVTDRAGLILFTVEIAATISPAVGKRFRA